MTPVIVLGAGGHARVLIDALRLRKVKILGVTEADPNAVGIRKLRLDVLGDDRAVLRFKPREVRLVNGLGSVKVGVQRSTLFNKFKEKGYLFETVVHPSAVIAADVELGEGAQVMAGAVIQTGAKIGANTIVNTRVSVDHDCVIGKHVHLAPGAVLSGGVTVGDGSHLGTGAVVVNGIRIGTGAFVAAHSLVRANLQAGGSIRAARPSMRVRS